MEAFRPGPVAGVLVATAGLSGILLYKWFTRSTSNSEGDYPVDTVILHVITPFMPCLDPSAIKMETYLRMAHLPYRIVQDQKASNCSSPWISYNGHKCTGTAVCIDFLNQICTVGLNSWMSHEQRATAFAFQELAEGLLRNPLLSEEEVINYNRKKLTALNDFIDTKNLLSGHHPCEQDCAVFGHLSQIYWNLSVTARTTFREEFPCLPAYCERVKDTYFPDWNWTIGWTQDGE